MACADKPEARIEAWWGWASAEEYLKAASEGGVAGLAPAARTGAEPEQETKEKTS